MMDIAGFNKAVSDLFIEGSHHRNLSVINFTQSLFPKGKNSVTQCRKTQYLVVFKLPMSQDRLACLCSPANWIHFSQCTERLHYQHLDI